MNAHEFNEGLDKALHAIQTLRNSGGTNITNIQLARSYPNEVWMMTVEVNDIPGMHADFSDTSIFTAHQGIVECRYVAAPSKQFVILGFPSAVQRCITQYMLNTTVAALAQFATRYRAAAAGNPAAFPLVFSDVRAQDQTAMRY
jgi:acyl CoA:acetate/3-ketoacid CoA transferase alpha subunit